MEKEIILTKIELETTINGRKYIQFIDKAVPKLPQEKIQKILPKLNAFFLKTTTTAETIKNIYTINENLDIKYLPR